jgi:hypothetical protein
VVCFVCCWVVIWWMANRDYKSTMLSRCFDGGLEVVVASSREWKIRK